MIRWCTALWYHTKYTAKNEKKSYFFFAMMKCCSTINCRSQKN